MSPRSYIIWTLVGMVVLLLIFGKNPMDDMRKQRAERQGKKLVEKIADANKKKSGIGGMLSGDGGAVGSSGRTPGTVDWEAEKKAAAANPSNAVGNVQAPRGTTYGSNPNPFMSANPYVRPQAPDTIAQDPGRPGTTPRPQGTLNKPSGYYPPPPLKKGQQQQFDPQSSLSPEDLKKAEIAAVFTRRKNSEHSHPNFTTDDGKSLAYFGTKVYTFAEDGSPKPMPDGKYSMYNGRWFMEIRDGEQTIGTGDSAFWRQ